MFPVPARAQASHDGSARDPADEDGRNDVSITQGGQLDEAKLEAFVGQAVTDMGAAISGLLLHMGDRLGLYKAMAGAGPMTPASLAARTGTTERYVREWLRNQAGRGLGTHHSARGPLETPAGAGMGLRHQGRPGFPSRALPALPACFAPHRPV